ncbi:MAG: exonuclease [bacterium]|nr:exonuclease [bacterium]
MSWIMVDIEADGPIPGDYSMISIGAVVVDKTLSKTFYGELKPISGNCIPEALNVSGFTREQTLTFEEPKAVMEKFALWLKENSKGRPQFISDNNGFDWMFVCWYFHHFTGSNPFGFSSSNLGSIYKGVVKNFFENFKHLRKTKHTHNPVDDAKGNAEAFLAIVNNHDIKIKL